MSLYLDWRSQIHEFVTPLRKVIETQKQSSEFLRARLAQTHQMEMQFITKTFDPYVSEQINKESIFKLIQLNTSWNAWSFFRNEHQQSIEESRILLELQILAILKHKELIYGS